MVRFWNAITRFVKLTMHTSNLKWHPYLIIGVNIHLNVTTGVHFNGSPYTERWKQVFAIYGSRSYTLYALMGHYIPPPHARCTGGHFSVMWCQIHIVKGSPSRNVQVCTRRGRGHHITTISSHRVWAIHGSLSRQVIPGVRSRTLIVTEKWTLQVAQLVS